MRPASLAMENCRQLIFVLLAVCTLTTTAFAQGGGGGPPAGGSQSTLQSMLDARKATVAQWTQTMQARGEVYDQCVDRWSALEIRISETDTVKPPGWLNSPAELHVMVPVDLQLFDDGFSTCESSQSGIEVMIEAIQLAINNYDPSHGSVAFHAIHRSIDIDLDEAIEDHQAVIAESLPLYTSLVGYRDSLGWYCEYLGWDGDEATLLLLTW